MQNYKNLADVTEYRLEDRGIDNISVSSWLCDISLKDCILTLQRQAEENRISIYTAHAFIPSFTTWSKIMITWILQLIIPFLYCYYGLQQKLVYEQFELCPGYRNPAEWQIKLIGFLLAFCIYFLTTNRYSALGHNWNYQLYKQGYKMCEFYLDKKNDIVGHFLKRRTLGMFDIVTKHFSIWIMAISCLLLLFFQTTMPNMLIHCAIYAFLFQVDEMVVSVDEKKKIITMCQDMLTKMGPHDPTMTALQQSLIVKTYWQFQYYFYTVFRCFILLVPFYQAICK